MFFKLRLLLLSALLCLSLSSCSDSEEEEKGGIIKQHNDKMVQKSIDYIKTPLEKAKLAKEAQEKHNLMVEEAIKPQE